jgi:hypothetical protein
MTQHKKRALGGVAVVAAAAVGIAATGQPAPTEAASRTDLQKTVLISRGLNGAMPNAPSTNAVISNDKRYSRVIAFESDASNMVQGDTNGTKDVFAVLRAGHIGNKGAPWEAGRTVLLSRGMGGQPANGPSFLPAISGGFHSRPKCAGFLSAASNLVPGDTNGKLDAFVTRASGGKVRRVSRPGGRQSTDDTTAIAVSSNCKRIAFVTGGRLYVSKNGRRAKRRGPAQAADPAFSTGLRDDLVFGAPKGVYLAKRATGRPRLVARGGRNPAFNDIKRKVVTYEKTVNGHTQIAYKELGKREKVISSFKRNVGNGDSRDPVIGNSGYYVAFETDASNLGVTASKRTGDENSKPDAYLYSDVRDMTLVQSVQEKSVPQPGGGQNPSMSFYANYIVFDAPAPLGRAEGEHQIYMRYLGPA